MCLWPASALKPLLAEAEAAPAAAGGPSHPMLHMHSPNVRMQTSCIECSWNLQLRNCMVQLLSTLRAVQHAVVSTWPVG